jgi:putative membrane protein
MWHTDDVGWGWWLVMAAEMVLFWGVVIYVILRLARGTNSVTRPNPEPAEPGDAPLVVLKRRVAAGEISVEEYDALRAVIAESDSPTAPAPAVR